MREKAYFFILKVFGIVWVYLTPVHDIVIGVSILVCLDFITGIMAAYKTKQKLTSKGFRQTITKTFVYQSAIIVAMVLETHLIKGVPVIKIVSSLIAVTETKSFFENVEKITGIDFWAKIANKVQHLLEKGKRN